MARSGQRLSQAIQVVNGDGRVSLEGRTEILLYAEMDLHRAALQPETAAPRERGGLRHLLHAQERRIELPAPFFRAFRDRQLNMVEAQHQTPVRYAITSCSMAPKIEWPARSFISMRIVSPKRMKGVLASPVQDRLDGALFGDAGIADPALGDGLARPAVLVLVGHGAGADDRAGAERPGLGRMGDQGREIEGHVRARIGLAEGRSVEGGEQGQVQLAAVPGIAEFVGGDGDGREGRGGLGVEEAESLRQLRRESGSAGRRR